MSLQKSEYVEVLNALKAKIRSSRTKAAISLNVEMLKLYWEIGSTILEQQAQEGWGAKIIDTLAADLKSEFPDFKGLSVRNLKYMRAFAEAYPAFGSIVQPVAAQLQVSDNKSDEIVQAPLAQIGIGAQSSIVQGLLAQLSWYHHITLLDKIKEASIREFYIGETVKNGWSRDVMVHQIEGGLHDRIGKVPSNFKNTLAPDQSELVQQLFKDPYKFEFIYLGKEAKERDLEDALTSQLTKFLLELGQHFAYLGRQYKIMLGENEYFFDLLFYHTRLKRYIVIELKIDEFKPEYKGKMEFYLNLADEHLKQSDDEKSIGLILCKTKDGLVVEYALRDSTKPIGIAEYKISEMLPADIRGELPTVEELEAEIEKEMQELKKPVDKKLDRLKEMIAGLNQPEVKEQRSPELCLQIFDEVLLPLRDAILLSIAEITEQFRSIEITLFTDGFGFNNEKDTRTTLMQRGEAGELKVDIRLKGFKAAGVKAFDIWKDLKISTNQYNYTIYVSHHQPIEAGLEKLYHEKLSTDEIQVLIDRFKEMVIDDITAQLERIKNQNA